MLENRFHHEDQPLGQDRRLVRQTQTAQERWQFSSIVMSSLAVSGKAAQELRLHSRQNQLIAHGAGCLVKETYAS